MNLFDILGPVMVGPSSSILRELSGSDIFQKKLLQDHVRKAEILLHVPLLPRESDTVQTRH